MLYDVEAWDEATCSLQRWRAAVLRAALCLVAKVALLAVLLAGAAAL